MERRFIKERQREGIEKAKSQGVYQGGKVRLDHSRVIARHKQGEGASSMPNPSAAHGCRYIAY